MIAIAFAEGAPTKQFESLVDGEMQKPLQHFDKELSKLRTGRSHTSMIEDIRVNAYGTLMPLRELAALSAPEPQLLVVQPWDKGVMNDIERAISLSDLGVSPVNDGIIIRVVLPKMSSSRREEIVKILAKRLEECRVAVRNLRKDIHNLIRIAEKDKKISEDYSKRLQTVLQKSTDAAIEKAEQSAQRKEGEIKSL